MPVSKSIRKLLLIRKIEEDNARAELESAISALYSRETALMRNVCRAREGRRLVAEGVRAVDQRDLIAGMNEQMIAALHAGSLRRQVDEARECAETLRQEYLIARMNRHQAQTLVEAAIARDEQNARRHTQQGLDEWHRDHSRRNKE